MKQDIAMKWADALESGEYKQAKEVLFDGEGYCCLGVLCKLMGREFVETPDYIKQNFGIKTIDEDEKIEWETTTLPYDLIVELDMHSSVGYLDGIGNAQLTVLNDDGDDFPTIAKIIRENWEAL